MAWCRLRVCGCFDRAIFEAAGVGHCGFERRSRLFAEAAGWAWLKHAVLVVDRAAHGDAESIPVWLPCVYERKRGDS